MRRYFRILADTVLGLLAEAFRTSLQRSLEIEGLKVWLAGVAALRRLFLLTLLGVTSLLLCTVGVVMFHVGLMILLPWSLAAKAVTVAGLGLVYCLVACVLLRYACQESTWMRLSGASQWLDRLVGPDRK